VLPAVVPGVAGLPTTKPALGEGKSTAAGMTWPVEAKRQCSPASVLVPSNPEHPDLEHRPPTM
jgi:hypothetical protein